MTDEKILKKLEETFNCLSKELNSIVVPFESLILKAELDKNQMLKYERILKSSGLFKLDYKDDGILVNRKNFKPVEKPMTTPKNTTNNKLKLHDRIKALRDALSEGLYEKEEAVRLALLTAIAGESIFFLGNPGCAKSMIACRIKEAFKADDGSDAKWFEYLMNQFSTPEDIFGPISLKALNAEGESEEEEYKRITKNMLPEADIAFLDEIWKASAAIQNTLLNIINERKFSNGGERKKVPLKALFTASNELPKKNEGHEALFDRFILRLIVNPIQNEDNFFEMVDESTSHEFKMPDGVKPISVGEWNAWKEKIDEVSLSDAAKSVIRAVRNELVLRNEAMSEDEKKNDELFEVSDRRWKKIVHILKTSAFLNDRTEIDLMDCQLIEYCIWSTEKQQKIAREIVEKCIQQNGLDCDTAIDEIKEQIEEFDAYITDNFYIDNPDFKKIVKETIDGEEYYKVDYKNHTKCWISESALLDSDKKTKIADVRYFNVDEDSRDITCDIYISERWEDDQKPSTYYWCSEKIKDSKVFDTPDLLELRRTKAENEKYKIVANKIETEIEKLDIFAKEQTAPYRANLFADQHYCDVIMNAVTEAKKDLQNAQVELDKKRSRYQE